MCKIVKTIEQFLHVGNKEKEDLYFRNTQGKGMSHDQLRTAVARSALEAVDVSKAKAIIVFSETGEMAKTLSKGRPNCIIISFTEKKCEVKVNDLRLHYGIYPHEVEYGSGQYIDSTVAEAERVILDRGLLELGDNVVVVGGNNLSIPSLSNVTKVYRFGEFLRHKKSIQDL